MKHYDYLIVGSGLFGSTFAHLAAKEGKSCLVIDKRSHLGGNVYCESIEGINVHKYGAHIFHTSDKEVWDFVNAIVPFNRYTNSPVANYKGKLYNLPFNMNTFYQMWGVTTPQEAAQKIEEQRAEFKEELTRKNNEKGLADEPHNLEEQAMLLVGKDIYERLIKGYTEKQWGRKCCELPAFIIKRLPVRMVFDNNYFNDSYQGIPVGGYNRLIEGLLCSTDTMTSTDFFRCAIKDADGHCVDLKTGWRKIADKLVFTGKIDEFYGYRYGMLNYRTVSFEQETINSPNYQGNAVVNYTEGSVPYTRIIEHKHFEMFGNEVYSNGKTVISKEYSTEWKDGLEPYYPINDKHNSDIYARYRALAEKETDIVFGGRLAEYRYYDMAPVIRQAMNFFRH